MSNYTDEFRGKIVYCNCDNPKYSAFWEYFHLNFSKLGLKKLICTYYTVDGISYKCEYVGGCDNNIEVSIKAPLTGCGDFRSKECLDILLDCDIVVTNPPFSLFRDFITVIMTNKKKFLVIGSILSIIKNIL